MRQRIGPSLMPSRLWTDTGSRRIVAIMQEAAGCAICGQSIDVGQAWMEADRDGARVRAHSECLYREERAGLEGWEPQDHAAS